MHKSNLLRWSFFIIVVGGFFLSSATDMSGQEDLGWKVWVKTSPCSGRQDWVSVAKENPSHGGGSGVWSNADLILTGTGMNCVRNIDQSCSFAQANAEAATVRASDKFFDYCCRDYSVWQNSQTKEMTVVVGKFGTAGFGWDKVKGDLCCDEAEALAQIPGACGGSHGGGSGLSGSWKIIQTAPNGRSTVGVLKINLAGNAVSGRAEWQGHAYGNIKGTVQGRTIKFDVLYEGGLIGSYEAELSSDGNQMQNGKAKSNKGGDVVTWRADKT